MKTLIQVNIINIFLSLIFTVALACILFISPHQTNADSRCSVFETTGSTFFCDMSNVSDACKNSRNCSTYDQAILRAIQGRCADSLIQCTDAERAEADAANQIQANPYRTGAPTLCATTWDKMTNPGTCLARGTTTFIAALLIRVSSWILWIAGLLFNNVFDQTIIKFNEWLTPMMGAIGITWTFFRDITNIMIIGLFVFIAINMILGIKSFGDKKLIARVLIIAILINFSFLFTRIIINFSNLLSTSFSQTLTAGSTGAAQANPDVASQFTRLLGISDSFSTDWDTLAKVAETNDSAFTAIIHAVLVVAVALAFAYVLMYASILLIARSVMLIVLLFTSSLAFATYLVPALADSDYGWSTWWSALIKNAILAPVMVLLLSAVLQISSKMGNGSGGSTQGLLGGLVNAPQSNGNITALLNYLVILGLLYGAIRISSLLSTQGGLRLAGASVALGSKYIAAPLGRQTIGRFALGRSEVAKDAAKDYLKKAATARANNDPMLAKKYDELSKRAARRSARYDGIAGRKFNAMDTGIGQSLAKSLKLGAFSGASGKGTLSVTEANKVREEAASKIIEKVQPSKKDQEGIRDAIAEGFKNEHGQNKEALEKEHAKIATERNAARETAVREHDAKTQIVNEQKSRLADMIRSGQGDLGAQRRRITEAQREAHDAAQNVQIFDDLKLNIDGKLISYNESLKNIADHAKALKTEQDTTVDAVLKSAGERAGMIGERQGDILTRTLGAITGDNQRVGNKLRAKYTKGGSYEHEQDIHHLAAAISKHSGHGNNQAAGQAEHGAQ